MRIMIDTNVLISALLFRNQRMDLMMHTITSKYQLVLSSYIMAELLAVAERKFKDKGGAMDLLLSQIPYELVYTPKVMKKNLFEIRDEKDYPILYSAITEDVDVFISGDQDFHCLSIDRPEILTPSQFIDKYC